MNSNKIYSTLSFIILGLTIFGFIWLIAVANTKTAVTSFVDVRYQTVEIESIKKDVTDLLSGRQNVSGMPIPEPSNKMGKDNPFSSL